MTTAKAAWGAGVAAYLTDLTARLSSVWSFTIKPEDAITLLLVAIGAALVFRPE